jgi:hypothetical protein
MAGDACAVHMSLCFSHHINGTNIQVQWYKQLKSVNEKLIILKHVIGTLIVSNALVKQFKNNH